MPILMLVIVGAAAGFLATRFMKLDADVPTTVAIGIFGALVGGLILRALVTMASWAAGFVGAVMGAMLLIWLWRRWAGRR
ncbi:MAG: GlsB/YeaQ/YmgE family stress response membrane protein [Rhodobacterales bacterium]|nr:GlsB/YeaQ/YmgE family stress response membrane protein [Rhodobacterales bacterium]MDX5499463.1 GlsB/YeaQ/YmgE family stress response membrane protein [Rhodobacterales bacterium]